MTSVLERDDLLDDLSNLLHTATEVGSMVFLEGEAGSGKSTVVNALASSAKEALILLGSCDPLITPRPLGPLIDIAEISESALTEIIGSDDRPAIFSAVLERLKHTLRPILMIVEDAHWADAATLDLITYLGRRVSGAKALILVTYRGDELAPDHPLRPVLGGLLPKAEIYRFSVPMLTKSAIEQLAGSRSIDAEEVLAVTGGNAFYVTELLASDRMVPGSVEEAVLARVGALGPHARKVAEAVAIAPRSLEPEHIKALTGTTDAAIGTAVNAGVLVGDTAGYHFRHELARLAVESSIPTPRLTEMHRLMLDRLRETDDPARLAHHAIKTEDPQLILELVPPAAHDAARRQSHHEAVSFMRAAHPHIQRLPAAARYDFLSTFRVSLHAIDRQAEALQITNEMFDLAATSDDPTRLADAYLARGLAVWITGHTAEAARHLLKAVELLEPMGDSAQLAGTLRRAARQEMLDRHYATAWSIAHRSLAMARHLKLEHEEVHALLDTGTIELVMGDAEKGIALIEEAIVLGEVRSIPRLSIDGYSMLGTGGGEVRLYERALGWLSQTIEIGQRADEDYAIAYSKAWMARIKCEQGVWDEAEQLAEQVTEYEPGVARISPVTALGALGRVRVRRGDDGAEELLCEAIELGARGSLQHIWSPLCALAEFHWLRGNLGAATDVLEEPFARVMDTDSEWGRGEMAYWMWRVGGLEEVPERIARPFASMIIGEWQDAAREWKHLGCPYEEALALSQGDLEGKLRALEIFDELGARPASGWLRKILREEGTSSIPRGPRESTRSNLAGMTARQSEVYALLVKGLSNAEIADQLFLSPRTVEHHVSAILMKLGVTSRADAIARSK